jgi:hypothetical protein
MISQLRKCIAPAILAVGILTGCQLVLDQQVGELPTLAVLPSLTPSATATITPSATATLTLTSTATVTASTTPSRTPTVTSTATLTPSATATATVTSSPTSTSTATRTPTSTRTSTPRPPTATATFTLTPTPDLPIIQQFQASAASAQAGTAFQIIYAALNADSVRIEQLNPQGAIIQSFPSALSGVLPVLAQTTTGRVAFYRMVASKAGVEVAQTLTVIITCPIPWFFGDLSGPADIGCPQALGAAAAGAYQTFERGQMIYVSANGLNRIYGLQNDGSRYIVYVNGWDGTTINSNPAPPGLFIPEQMFNWAYYNTNAPIGAWNPQVGWAIGAIDTSPRTIQFEANSTRFYIDVPGGAVYRFSGGDSGTWSRIR